MVKYLAERYDLTDPRLAFLGASAGSLMVVLAACGVPAGQAPGGTSESVLLFISKRLRHQPLKGFHYLDAVDASGPAVAAACRDRQPWRRDLPTVQKCRVIQQ